MTGAALRVRTGHILALRLFDAAHEIDLKQAETAWAARASGVGVRSRLLRTPEKAVSFGVPPLALDLGALPDGATASARLYDFGIVALSVRVPVGDLAWADFVARVNAAGVAASVWRDLLGRVEATIGGALVRPTMVRLEEDYLIAQVEAFDAEVSGEEIMQRVDLAPLLSGETRALSEPARRDLLAQRFSYFTDDLAVITWDRAFLYEPRRDSDVADVLEIANAQLLEMRAYDEALDAELPRLQGMMEAARGWRSARRYARLARRLHGLVAEVSALGERVDNALQVTEDVYLARVYAAAMTLFRVPSVGAAVDRKLMIVREAYSALYSEAAGGRAELLEMAILLLIAVELVLSVVRH
jgi:hypothetical protein